MKRIRVRRKDSLQATAAAREAHQEELRHVEHFLGMKLPTFADGFYDTGDADYLKQQAEMTDAEIEASAINMTNRAVEETNRIADIAWQRTIEKFKTEQG